MDGFQPKKLLLGTIAIGHQLSHINPPPINHHIADPPHSFLHIETITSNEVRPPLVIVIDNLPLEEMECLVGDHLKEEDRITVVKPAMNDPHQETRNVLPSNLQALSIMFLIVNIDAHFQETLDNFNVTPALGALEAFHIEIGDLK
jgi:hypothetical protein